MAEENNQESTPQKAEQVEPEKKDESLSDILTETITDSSKETDKKAEPTTQDEQPKEKGEAETETEKDSSEGLTPRADFDDEEKELFNSLDDNRKKLMLNKWAKLESGFNKKFENLAKERKTAEEFNHIYEPYKQQLELAGISPMQYTKQLMAADKFIRENPEKGIMWLAQQSGVDLTKLSQTPEEQDPTTQEINSLKGELGNLKQELSQREMSVLAKQVEDFKNTKDTQGNLKYPHFDAVKEEMARLNMATGESNLEKLYNKAIRLNDDLYQKQLDAELAKKQAEAQKQADLAKAKKAGRPIRSSPNAKVAKKENVDLDTILQEELS